MKSKKKKKYISLLILSSIITTSLTHKACQIAQNGYVSVAYNINKETIIKKTDKKKPNQYASFYENIFDNSLKLPIEEEMVPQGITKMNEYILLSFYDNTSKHNSCIYTLDKEGKKINRCFLDSKAHVGSVAYDKNNDLVWIPGPSGKLNAYLASDFLEKENTTPIYSNADIGVNLPNYMKPWNNSISYLCIFHNNLYVGNFSLFKNGLVKQYNINNTSNKEITLTYIREFKVPTKVQGLTFYETKDKNYILFSRSFGEFTPSIIQIFPYNIEIDDYTKQELPSISYPAPSMIEQITTEEDKLYLIFESFSTKFKYCQDKTNDIYILDNKKLIKNLK